jgi:enterochelin esterase-like enzyme
MIAVLVDNPAANRDQELSCSREFSDFVAKELLPWIRTNYRVSLNAEDVVISGSSLGGLQATCTAFWHPELFGNVLAQSSSYWWKPDSEPEYEWIARQFETSKKLSLKFYLTVGKYETLPKPGNTNQLLVNRKFADVLKQKGYAVSYLEFYGAHEYVDWQGTLADGLISLSAIVTATTRNSTSSYFK